MYDVGLGKGVPIELRFKDQWFGAWAANFVVQVVVYLYMNRLSTMSTRGFDLDGERSTS